jgi:hypothetical protein
MKMKQLLFGLLATTVGFTAQTQTNIYLSLNHEFDGAAFQYGTVYQVNGVAVQMDRVQYYLSGFELAHDGGQTLTMSNACVLGSANISSYLVGPANITTLEGVSFDLGVDAARNGMGTQSWDGGQPLGAQSPAMDWGWPAGYFFWILNGKVDTNMDGVPDQLFSMQGLGNAMLTDVPDFSGLSASAGTLTIPINVNIAGWLEGIDLTQVYSAHDGGPFNQAIASNTNDETVFSMGTTLNTDELTLEQSHMYADYTIAYAPTIYYDLATTNTVDITVVDMAGAVVLEAAQQNPEGNYFIRKELPDGTYLINFSNGELNEQLRFVVKN